MRKDDVVRFVAILLVVTLLSICSVSRILEKYTTGDTAHNTVTSTEGDTVETVSDSLFLENYQ